MKIGAVPFAAVSPRRRTLLEILAYLALLVVYVCDVVTPPELSIEVDYEVPIAIAALSGSRAAIVRLTIAGLIANAAGYWSDAVFWKPTAIAIQNHVIAIASLILVSALSLIIQSTAAHVARLQERQHAMIAEREMAQEIERRGEQLFERQEVIRDLVETIAHDVRTPLEALSLTLSQALRGQYGELPPSYQEVVRESRISIGDITRLADTVLTLARFEAQNAPPECVAVNISTLAYELVAEFSPLAEAREIVLTHDVPEFAFVSATVGDLRRAIANLLSNAIRHTPPGGRILLGASACDGGWRIDVVDDGIGLPPAHAANLFARYMRGAEGAGLGLYIAKRIAESFGGTIAYAPVSPHGARFSLELLLWKAAA